MQVQPLGREDPLEKDMATNSSLLAQRIPRTEESGGLQSTASPRVGQDWNDLARMHACVLKNLSTLKAFYLIKSLYCRERDLQVATPKEHSDTLTCVNRQNQADAPSVSPTGILRSFYRDSLMMSPKTHLVQTSLPTSCLGITVKNLIFEKQSTDLQITLKKKKKKEWQGMHVCSAVSDSVQPHGLQPTRLLCPWNPPGRKTGVGCYLLLQRIFPTQGLNPCFLCFLH